MRLFIGKSILKREFGGDLSAEDHGVFRRAVRPGLLLEIKGSGLPAKTKLLKGYATSRQGPRRIVCLLMVEKDDYFVLFFRRKGDPVGDNVSIRNPSFKVALDRHLALLRGDMLAGNIQEIPLAS
jgi:hypothetical protein